MLGHGSDREARPGEKLVVIDAINLGGGDGAVACSMEILHEVPLVARALGEQAIVVRHGA
jgi:hypothetical protein